VKKKIANNSSDIVKEGKAERKVLLVSNLTWDGKSQLWGKN